MKVSGHDTQSRVERARAKNGEPNAAGGQDRESTPSTGEATRVEMSSAARTMRASKAPETIDADKVERLRAAIDDGSFQIDADAIAERMMEEER